MQAVIYIRVSSEEQITGTSLASQEELCRRYCQERQLAIAEVFREEGESAKTADRTSLLRSLDFCRKHRGEISAFVVAKVDRFARNTEDHFYIRKLLADNGIRLHSVTEPIGNSPTEKFVETMLAASAEFDNAIRKQRCSDGMIARINQGILPFRPPIGYLCARHRLRGEKKTKPDEPDPIIFPIIQKALRAYATGEVRSLQQLREQLDSWGLAKARGKATPVHLVDRILGQYLPFYAGVLINPWTKTTHLGQHSAMISGKEAERIKLIRAGRLKPFTKRKDRFNPLFPLRRTVRCPICHSCLTGAVSQGRSQKYAYYFCHRNSCRRQSRQIRRETLHAAFQSFITSIAPSAEELRVIEATVADVWTRRHALNAESATQRQIRAGELEKRRQRVFAMREDGSYTQPMFEERLAAVDADLSALRALSLSQQMPPHSIGALTAALRWLCESLRLWWDLAPQVRSRFEQFMFPEGVYFAPGIGIRTAKPGPIFDICPRTRGLESLEVDLGSDGSHQCIDILAELVELQREVQDTIHSTSLAA